MLSLCLLQTVFLPSRRLGVGLLTGGVRETTVILLRGKVTPVLALQGRGRCFVALQGVWVYFFKGSNVTRCGGALKRGRCGMRGCRCVVGCEFGCGGWSACAWW